MATPSDIQYYKNHRFPVEIISHAVWLYSRFCLSFRDIKELLCERGLVVPYEAIRKWCRKFGQQYANQLGRRRPWPGDKWQMDEVFLTIKGEGIIFGGPWIKTGTSSISWCNVAVIRGLQRSWGEPHKGEKSFIGFRQLL